MPKIVPSRPLLVLLPFFIASLAGCTEDEAPTGLAPSAPRASEAPAEAQPAPQIDPSTLPSPPESPAAQGPVSNPDEPRLREMLETLSEAAEAAADEDPNGSHCERAYESSRRLAMALSEAMGGTPVREDTPELQTGFIAGCERLPEEVQQCMVMSYSVANREECAELRRTASPETRAAVREVMTGLGPLANTALPSGE